MSYNILRLNRPYDFRVLIEAFVYTRRQDFLHEDFSTYYAGLLRALEGLFGIRLSRDGLPFDHLVLWGLFESVTASLLRITHPWDGYLEDGLLNRKLVEAGAQGVAVYQASSVIAESNKASEAAHKDMLYALFFAIFGQCKRVVTSEELKAVGFDDTLEPDTVNYWQFT